MTELVGNKSIENAAVDFVINYERQQGRKARDTRRRGAPADVESPPRLIEIKAYGGSARGNDLWLETHQVETAESNVDFYVYIVENVRQGDPCMFTIRILGGDHLRRLLTRKKPQGYYTVPWPVSDYDATPPEPSGTT